MDPQALLPILPRPWGAGRCTRRASLDPCARYRSCFQIALPSMEDVGGFIACGSETLIMLAGCQACSHLQHCHSPKSSCQPHSMTVRPTPEPPWGCGNSQECPEPSPEAARGAGIACLAAASLAIPTGPSWRSSSMPQSHVQPRSASRQQEHSRTCSWSLRRAQGMRVVLAGKTHLALWSFRGDSRQLETAGFPRGETIIFVLVLARVPGDRHRERDHGTIKVGKDL